jgi:adenylate cyclase class IV
MIEIEVKTLLGEKENADKLREKLGEVKAKSRQKNHYFILNSKEKFSQNMKELIKNKELFDKVVSGEDISIRTRETENEVIFVIKSAIDDTTSSNGISRMEFEEVVPMTLAELDQKIINSGCEYQAKWSREREEFLKDNVTITIDKNAGYGYLAEFEIVANEENQVEEAKNKIYSLMKSFNLEELDKDRLSRMFEYYNNNWRDYYGTEKTFVIE